MASVQKRQGDIADATETYIVHQGNCETTTAKGLARHLFQRFPKAAIVYRPGNVRVPGTIQLIDRIVTLFGQHRPGRPSRTETAAQRETWFAEGLAALTVLVRPGESVAFPYQIGCGLGGGDWAHYAAMIDAFAAALPPSCKVSSMNLIESN